MKVRPPLLGVAVLSAVAAFAGVARGDASGVEAFERAWAEARGDVEAQVAAIEDLARGAPGVEAAELLLRIGLDDAVAYPARDAAEANLPALFGPEVVRWAAEELDRARDPRRRTALCDPLAERAPEEPEAVAALHAALEDDHWSVRVAAVRGLAAVRRPDTVTALVACLDDAEGGRVAEECARVLRRLTGEDLREPEEWVSWWAAVGDGYRLPEEDPAGEHADADERDGRTIVRGLDPPGGGGRTIFDEVTSRRVVFVVDVSYSMRVRAMTLDEGGEEPLTRLAYVREELAAAVEEQLGRDDRFGLIAFSTEVHPWKRRLVEATSGNERSALRFVRSLRPDGETNISDALEAAFAYEDVDTIYFLTDGTPTRGRITVNEDILGAVRRWNAGRQVRVCTVAFLAGDAEEFSVMENRDMSERFLRALAEQNDGTFKLFD